jgi:DNA-binding response OmpR family regulator
MTSETPCPHILLVDDDADLREALAEQLLHDRQFVVSQVADGMSGVEFMTQKSEIVDLVILDVGLPDEDGRNICSMMRKQGVTCPILMLTAQDTDMDTIRGLEAGANDYISKPFKFSVLLARIQTHLRQYAQSEHATVKIGPYAFKIAARTLTDKKGTVIRLTDKESNILQFLYKAQKPVNKDILLDKIWGYNSNVTTHTLETHIYRLRQKIEQDPSNATLLLRDEDGYLLKA